MKLSLYSGAGNRFAAVDLRRQELPLARAAFAREVCQRWQVDGVLLALPPRQTGHVRMLVLNSDGSQPEACGNGLRCLAAFARESGFAAADHVQVETDAGQREVTLLRVGARIVAARASMGAGRVLEQDLELLDPAERFKPVRGTVVDMGNPHFVMQVADERQSRVREIGAWVETHARFPRRINVGFAAVRDGGLHLRVWERGVGETAACGTGACAAALALAVRGLVRSPVEVHKPGGTLEVSWSDSSQIFLRGPCLWEGDVAFDSAGLPLAPRVDAHS